MTNVEILNRRDFLNPDNKKLDKNKTRPLSLDAQVKQGTRLPNRKPLEFEELRNTLSTIFKIEDIQKMQKELARFRKKFEGDLAEYEKFINAYDSVMQERFNEISQEKDDFAARPRQMYLDRPFPEFPEYDQFENYSKEKDEGAGKRARYVQLRNEAIGWYYTQSIKEMAKYRISTRKEFKEALDFALGEGTSRKDDLLDIQGVIKEFEQQSKWAKSQIQLAEKRAKEAEKHHRYIKDKFELDVGHIENFKNKLFWRDATVDKLKKYGENAGERATEIEAMLKGIQEYQEKNRGKIAIQIDQAGQRLTKAEAQLAEAKKRAQAAKAEDEKQAEEAKNLVEEARKNNKNDTETIKKIQAALALVKESNEKAQQAEREKSKAESLKEQALKDKEALENLLVQLNNFEKCLTSAAETEKKAGEAALETAQAVKGKKSDEAKDAKDEQIKCAREAEKVEEDIVRYWKNINELIEKGIETTKKNENGMKQEMGQNFDKAIERLDAANAAIARRDAAFLNITSKVNAAVDMRAGKYTYKDKDGVACWMDMKEFGGYERGVLRETDELGKIKKDADGNPILIKDADGNPIPVVRALYRPDITEIHLITQNRYGPNDDKRTIYTKRAGKYDLSTNNHRITLTILGDNFGPEYEGRIMAELEQENRKTGKVKKQTIDMRKAKFIDIIDLTLNEKMPAEVKVQVLEETMPGSQARVDSYKEGRAYNAEDVRNMCTIHWDADEYANEYGEGRKPLMMMKLPNGKIIDLSMFDHTEFRTIDTVGGKLVMLRTLGDDAIEVCINLAGTLNFYDDPTNVKEAALKAKIKRHKDDSIEYLKVALRTRNRETIIAAFAQIEDQERLAVVHDMMHIQRLKRPPMDGDQMEDLAMGKLDIPAVEQMVKSHWESAEKVVEARKAYDKKLIELMRAIHKAHPVTPQFLMDTRDPTYKHTSFFGLENYEGSKYKKALLQAIHKAEQLDKKFDFQILANPNQVRSLLLEIVNNAGTYAGILAGLKGESEEEARKKVIENVLEAVDKIEEKMDYTGYNPEQYALAIQKAVYLATLEQAKADAALAAQDRARALGQKEKQAVEEAEKHIEDIFKSRKEADGKNEAEQEPLGVIAALQGAAILRAQADVALSAQEYAKLMGKNGEAEQRDVAKKAIDALNIDIANIGKGIAEKDKDEAIAVAALRNATMIRLYVKAAKTIADAVSNMAQIEGKDKTKQEIATKRALVDLESFANAAVAKADGDIEKQQVARLEAVMRYAGAYNTIVKAVKDASDAALIAAQKAGKTEDEQKAAAEKAAQIVKALSDIAQMTATLAGSNGLAAAVAAATKAARTEIKLAQAIGAAADHARAAYAHGTKKEQDAAALAAALDVEDQANGVRVAARTVSIRDARDAMQTAANKRAAATGEDAVTLHTSSLTLFDETIEQVDIVITEALIPNENARAIVIAAAKVLVAEHILTIEQAKANAAVAGQDMAKANHKTESQQRSEAKKAIKEVENACNKSRENQKGLPIGSLFAKGGPAKGVAATRVAIRLRAKADVTLAAQTISIARGRITPDLQAAAVTKALKDFEALDKTVQDEAKNAQLDPEEVSLVAIVQYAKTQIQIAKAVQSTAYPGQAEVVFTDVNKALAVKMELNNEALTNEIKQAVEGLETKQAEKVKDANFAAQVKAVKEGKDFIGQMAAGAAAAAQKAAEIRGEEPDVVTDKANKARQAVESAASHSDHQREALIAAVRTAATITGQDITTEVAKALKEIEDAGNGAQLMKDMIARGKEITVHDALGSEAARRFAETEAKIVQFINKADEFARARAKAENKKAYEQEKAAKEAVNEVLNAIEAARAKVRAELGGRDKDAEDRAAIRAAQDTLTALSIRRSSGEKAVEEAAISGSHIVRQAANDASKDVMQASQDAENHQLRLGTDPEKSMANAADGKRLEISAKADLVLEEAIKRIVKVISENKAKQKTVEKIINEAKNTKNDISDFAKTTTLRGDVGIRNLAPYADSIAQSIAMAAAITAYVTAQLKIAQAAEDAARDAKTTASLAGFLDVHAIGIDAAKSTLEAAESAQHAAALENKDIVEQYAAAAAGAAKFATTRAELLYAAKDAAKAARNIAIKEGKTDQQDEYAQKAVMEVLNVTDGKNDKSGVRIKEANDKIERAKVEAAIAAKQTAEAEGRNEATQNTQANRAEQDVETKANGAREAALEEGRSTAAALEAAAQAAADQLAIERAKRDIALYSRATRAATGLADAALDTQVQTDVQAEMNEIDFVQTQAQKARKKLAEQNAAAAEMAADAARYWQSIADIAKTSVAIEHVIGTPAANINANVSNILIARPNGAIIRTNQVYYQARNSPNPEDIKFAPKARKLAADAAAREATIKTAELVAVLAAQEMADLEGPPPPGFIGPLPNPAHAALERVRAADRAGKGRVILEASFAEGAAEAIKEAEYYSKVLKAAKNAGKYARGAQALAEPAILTRPPAHPDHIAAIRRMDNAAADAMVRVITVANNTRAAAGAGKDSALEALAAAEREAASYAKIKELVRAASAETTADQVHVVAGAVLNEANNARTAAITGGVGRDPALEAITAAVQETAARSQVIKAINRVIDNPPTIWQNLGGLFIEGQIDYAAIVRNYAGAAYGNPPPGLTSSTAAAIAAAEKAEHLLTGNVGNAGNRARAAIDAEVAKVQETEKRDTFARNDEIARTLEDIVEIVRNAKVAEALGEATRAAAIIAAGTANADLTLAEVQARQDRNGVQLTDRLAKAQRRAMAEAEADVIRAAIAAYRNAKAGRLDDHARNAAVADAAINVAARFAAKAAAIRATIEIKEAEVGDIGKNATDLATAITGGNANGALDAAAKINAIDVTGEDTKQTIRIFIRNEAKAAKNAKIQEAQEARRAILQARGKDNVIQINEANALRRKIEAAADKVADAAWLRGADESEQALAAAAIAEQLAAIELEVRDAVFAAQETAKAIGEDPEAAAERAEGNARKAVKAARAATARALLDEEAQIAAGVVAAAQVAAIERARRDTALAAHEAAEGKTEDEKVAFALLEVQYIDKLVKDARKAEMQKSAQAFASVEIAQAIKIEQEIERQVERLNEIGKLPAGATPAQIANANARGDAKGNAKGAERILKPARDAQIAAIKAEKDIIEQNKEFAAAAIQTSITQKSIRAAQDARRALRTGATNAEIKSINAQAEKEVRDAGEQEKKKAADKGEKDPIALMAAFASGAARKAAEITGRDQDATADKAKQAVESVAGATEDAATAAQDTTVAAIAAAFAAQTIEMERAVRDLDPENVKAVKKAATQAQTRAAKERKDLIAQIAAGTAVAARKAAEIRGEDPDAAADKARQAVESAASSTRDAIAKVNGATSVQATITYKTSQYAMILAERAQAVGVVVAHVRAQIRATAPLGLTPNQLDQAGYQAAKNMMDVVNAERDNALVEDPDTFKADVRGTEAAKKYARDLTGGDGVPQNCIATTKSLLDAIKAKLYALQAVEKDTVTKDATNIEVTTVMAASGVASIKIAQELLAISISNAVEEAGGNKREQTLNITEAIQDIKDVNKATGDTIKATGKKQFEQIVNTTKATVKAVAPKVAVAEIIKDASDITRVAANTIVADIKNIEVEKAIKGLSAEKAKRVITVFEEAQKKAAGQGKGLIEQYAAAAAAAAAFGALIVEFDRSIRDLKEKDAKKVKEASEEAQKKAANQGKSLVEQYADAAAAAAQKRVKIVGGDQAIVNGAKQAVEAAANKSKQAVEAVATAGLDPDKEALTIAQAITDAANTAQKNAREKAVNDAMDEAITKAQTEAQTTIGRPLTPAEANTIRDNVRTATGTIVNRALIEGRELTTQEAIEAATVAKAAAIISSARLLAGLYITAAARAAGGNLNAFMAGIRRGLDNAVDVARNAAIDEGLSIVEQEVAAAAAAVKYARHVKSISDAVETGRRNIAGLPGVTAMSTFNAVTAVVDVSQPVVVASMAQISVAASAAIRHTTPADQQDTAVMTAGRKGIEGAENASKSIRMVDHTVRDKIQEAYRNAAEQEAKYRIAFARAMESIAVPAWEAAQTTGTDSDYYLKIFAQIIMESGKDAEAAAREKAQVTLAAIADPDQRAQEKKIQDEKIQQAPMAGIAQATMVVAKLAESIKDATDAAQANALAAGRKPDPAVRKTVEMVLNAFNKQRATIKAIGGDSPGNPAKEIAAGGDAATELAGAIVLIKEIVEDLTKNVRESLKRIGAGESQQNKAAAKSAEYVLDRIDQEQARAKAAGQDLDTQTLVSIAMSAATKATVEVTAATARSAAIKETIQELIKEKTVPPEVKHFKPNAEELFETWEKYAKKLNRTREEEQDMKRIENFINDPKNEVGDYCANLINLKMITITVNHAMKTKHRDDWQKVYPHIINLKPGIKPPDDAKDIVSLRQRIEWEWVTGLTTALSQARTENSPHLILPALSVAIRAQGSRLQNVKIAEQILALDTMSDVAELLVESMHTAENPLPKPRIKEKKPVLGPDGKPLIGQDGKPLTEEEDNFRTIVDSMMAKMKGKNADEMIKCAGEMSADVQKLAMVCAEKHIDHIMLLIKDPIMRGDYRKKRYEMAMKLSERYENSFHKYLQIQINWKMLEEGEKMLEKFMWEELKIALWTNGNVALKNFSARLNQMFSKWGDLFFPNSKIW